MTVFGRRKVERMQTEEQKYAAGAREQAAAADRKRRYDAVNQAASDRYRKQQTQKRARIRKVGEIRKIGPGRYETTGWEIDVTDGSVQGRVVEKGVRHEGTLAGFTVQELCAIAHGPRCRRCV